ncbi:hypothetical protein JIR23_28325 [Bradyrhizobium diazoefficiens]|nr:hypothetical protein [Bradyrhizobium diazoefficiens]QQN63388.1 hypothetical protein JIR23_28325 [Bradyrhizobium diazoefficiens]
MFFGNSETVSAEISSNWASFAGHKVKESLSRAQKPKKIGAFFETSRVANA